MSSIVKRTIISDSIASGMDELGIFLISDKFPSLWLGSNLSIEKARKQAKCNNATSLQVASSIIGAMQWAVMNPNAGIVESEELDEDVLYDFVEKYWSPMVATYTEWKPDKTGLLEFENFILSDEL
ncbi:hypothetical protein [Paraburkholderia aspalathi]|uniref:hypothetical protein n=1 Tax=Paraburkholderia aspalathi TaxID=1324617 RepID=UPI0019099989|nr:hypothetical protein [Paraburkholderia aspalathi]MBK3844562.1 hypothetical protein [Paraburkholderia aspalathi]